jgi:hypothetical protein
MRVRDVGNAIGIGDPSVDRVSILTIVLSNGCHCRPKTRYRIALDESSDQIGPSFDEFLRGGAKEDPPLFVKF